MIDVLPSVQVELRNELFDHAFGDTAQARENAPARESKVNGLGRIAIA